MSVGARRSVLQRPFRTGEPDMLKRSRYGCLNFSITIIKPWYFPRAHSAIRDCPLLDLALTQDPPSIAVNCPFRPLIR
jgi:hypothetical protein